MYTIATFYKFVPLPDYEILQNQLQTRCEQLGIKGSILLAAEGLNATLAGSQEALGIFLSELRQEPRFQDLEHKLSQAEKEPFQRMKVRLKREIVALGVPEVDPNQGVGTYIEPEAWNALISDPEVVLIDTRNRYETQIGTFKGAIDPQTESFREFPEYVQNHLDPQKHKKIAMFCTGGIRCEKATAYMLQQGFENVYHLKGGILKYLESVPARESLWEGDCFVFDERVAVTHDLKPSEHMMCQGCGYPLDKNEILHPKYEMGVACQHCADHRSPEQKAKSREKWQQLQARSKVSV